MAIHIPGILEWGDISLASALNKKTCLNFVDPVSISGRKITGKNLLEFKEKFSKMKTLFKTEVSFSFNN